MPQLSDFHYGDQDVALLSGKLALLTCSSVMALCRYDVTKQNPRGKVLAAALDETFDDELSNWLLAEMAENRDKHVGPNKVCCPHFTSPVAGQKAVYKAGTVYATNG